MKLLVFGSLNIDHTYHLPHLVKEGETLSSTAYAKNEGGKGFNQAVALAKAGLDISFAGAIGKDGLFLQEYLQSIGIDTAHIQVLDVPTGHAIIQVDAEGRNSIFLYGGANHANTEEHINQVLSHFQAGDYILLQNEINLGESILRKAHEKGMHIILNPSPISSELLAWPLELVDWFILNEVEGRDLTGCTDPDAILDGLLARFSSAHIVLTMGDKGSIYADAACRIHQNAIPAHVVDTTAAGDTFTGYFFAAMLSGKTTADTLRIAAAAASMAIAKPGAAKSIPLAKEVTL